MSSEAWTEFAVPGSPFFALVATSGEVLGEGTAGTWDNVFELVKLASRDATAAERSRSSRGVRREANVDQALQSAGILPGDASLYPEADGPTSRART